MNFFKKIAFPNLSNYFILLLIFFASCTWKPDEQEKDQEHTSFPNKISIEEKKWMNKFFTDFFLEDSAIYTLFGTKPMSQITIVAASEEDWMEAATPYLENVDNERKNEILNNIKQHCKEYDLDQNWEKWVSWRKDRPHSSFLFAKRSIDESQNLFNVYIINVPQAIWTFQKHYSLFSRELKMEFDPILMTLEFEDPNSLFWKKIFSNHLLEGILNGYGERNAYFFSQQFGKKKIYEESSAICIFGLSNSAKSQGEGKTLNDLQLPAFRSYKLPDGEDPVVTKYKKEREMIQRRLKGKDFVKEVLNQLYECDKEES